MMIGGWQNDRLNFIHALAQELDRKGISDYLFKLLSPKLPPLRKRLFKDYKLSKQFSKGLLEQFKLKATIPPHQYMEIMEQSGIIVDDVRIKQSGLTPRFIWALARNKKIITTNQYALQYNFVAPENVCIVDRKNPIIPKEFLDRDPVQNPDNPSFLEIKNWVRIITDEEPLPNFTFK
ncbi:MAG: hypothetical protein K2H59_09620 [Muribaculaceae bacterium]|nr:hypothetical protein [Muribaculaceae bacterium]